MDRSTTSVIILPESIDRVVNNSSDKYPGARIHTGPFYDEEEQEFEDRATQYLKLCENNPIQQLSRFGDDFGIRVATNDSKKIVDFEFYDATIKHTLRQINLDTLERQIRKGLYVVGSCHNSNGYQILLKRRLTRITITAQGIMAEEA